MTNNPAGQKVSSCCKAEIKYGYITDRNNLSCNVEVCSKCNKTCTPIDPEQRSCENCKFGYDDTPFCPECSKENNYAEWQPVPGKPSVDVSLKSKISDILCEFHNLANNDRFDKEKLLNECSNRIHDLLKSGKPKYDDKTIDEFVRRIECFRYYLWGGIQGQTKAIVELETIRKIAEELKREV